MTRRALDDWPAELVPVEDVQPGDRVLLPVLGYRVVLEVNEYDHLGMEPARCFQIVYALGASLAFENRASAAKGPSAVHQPEASIRLLRAGELVPIENRQ